VSGLHSPSAALALISCGHAICRIAWFVLAPCEFFPAPPCRNMSKSIALATYFGAGRSVASAASSLERCLADVSKDGMLAIYTCRSRFSGSANYTRIMGTFCAPAQPRGLGPFAVVAGPALWSDLSRQCLLSKSITTDFTARRCYHVSCTLSAPWRRCVATDPPTSTLATTSCCFTSRFGMTVSQNNLCVFSAQAGHGNK